MLRWTLEARPIRADWIRALHTLPESWKMRSAHFGYILHDFESVVRKLFSSFCEKRVSLALIALSLLLVQCSSGPKTWNYQYQNGKTSLLIGKEAVPQANIPRTVQRAVAAGNRLKDKPYCYGGGHRCFEDKGYDCSGTVSYVLHEAGLIKEATTSDELRHFGSSGEGKWITVYAKNGHAFIVVAGLRLDTSGAGGKDVGPRWTTNSRSIRGFRARHPEGL